MRAPAGFFPASPHVPHVTMAGSSIVCLACGTEGRLPLPRSEDYGRQVEGFVEAHRLCQAAEVRP